MDDRYPIPRPVWPDCHETTLLVKRSRFLTHAARAGSPAEAKAFIEAVSQKHADATHNCWAYVAGPPGSTARIGASDDGEPHGTAGRPMLQVLLHSGIGDVACVATRWFGGIKLGTGGLVRAYQDCVLQCLESLPCIEKVETVRLLVESDYAQLDRVKRLASQFAVSPPAEAYAEKVALSLEVARSDAGAFARALAEATDGRALLMAEDELDSPSAHGSPESASSAGGPSEG